MSAESNMTIAARFRLLDDERRYLIDRKRECAEYTFPRLLPPEGWDESQELDTPLSAVPATGASSLAAKIANAVLPTNGSPIVTPNIMVPSNTPPEAVEVVKNAVVSYDSMIMDKLQASNFRPELHAVCLDLVVIGDTLLELLPNGNFRKHRLDNYVVVRREDGSIYELIIRHWVDPKTLPKKLRERVGPQEEYTTGNRQLEPKYTRCYWDEEEETYEVCTEFREQPVEEDKYYTILPYFALKTGSSSAENYGCSIIEMIMGDIRSLMAHELSLLEGSAANAEFRLCVNPAGVTDLARLANSKNGDWVHARREDLHVMQLGSPVHVEITMSAVQQLSSRILKTLLYDLAYTTQNRERVTATEINATIQSIEGGLSSILSSITQELHVPLVRRISYDMSKDSNMPDPIKALAQGVVDNRAPLKLRSGIEALHKEIQSMRLLQAVTMLIQMPSAAQDIQWRNVVFDMMNGFGFSGERYLVSLQEKMQAQQMAMQNRVAENTAMAVGEQAAQNMAQPPEQMAQAVPPGV